MICKSTEYENGYIFTPTSTNEEFQEIIKSYDKVNCIICNKNTIQNFKMPFLGNPCVTINNKLNDGVFFVNKCF